MKGTGLRRLIILMLLLLAPLSSFSAGAIRLKYAYTLYDDEKGNGLREPQGVACGLLASPSLTLGTVGSYSTL